MAVISRSDRHNTPLTRLEQPNKKDLHIAMEILQAGAEGFEPSTKVLETFEHHNILGLETRPHTICSISSVGRARDF